MRRVYRAPGRGRDPHLRAAGRGGRRQTRDDHRGAVAQPEPRGAEGVDRRGRAAVRLLSIGPDHGRGGTAGEKPPPERSEEHTSELQSQSNLVCRLLLEKKKKNKQT